MTTVNNHTEIVVVIDESGSMQHLQKSTIDGYNKFVQEQRAAPGTANLTLVQFNTGWRIPIKSTSVNLVPALDTTAYRPDGGTALLDALGNAIKTIGDVVAGVPNQDVVFVVITDGGENSSTDFKHEQVKEMIKAREAQGWKFIYLGANQDAFAVAQASGMSTALTANYAASAAGTAASYSYSSGALSTMRQMKSQGVSLSDIATTEALAKVKAAWEKKLAGDEDATNPQPDVIATNTTGSTPTKP